MITLSFSQTNYPRTLILNSDTVVAITVDQLKRTNDIFIEKNECVEQREQQTEIIDNLKSINESMEIETKILDDQNTNLIKQTSLLKEQRDGIKKDNDKLATDLEKTKGKLLKRTKLLLISNSTVIGLILIIILL